MTATQLVIITVILVLTIAGAIAWTHELGSPRRRINRSMAESLKAMDDFAVAMTLLSQAAEQIQGDLRSLDVLIDIDPDDIDPDDRVDGAHDDQ